MKSDVLVVSWSGVHDSAGVPHSLSGPSDHPVPGNFVARELQSWQKSRRADVAQYTQLLFKVFPLLGNDPGNSVAVQGFKVSTDDSNPVTSIVCICSRDVVIF